jgi:hypothetical protein
MYPPCAIMEFLTAPAMPAITPLTIGLFELSNTLV